MTNTLIDLDHPTRSALVDLVVRGMYRGEPSSAQQALIDAGYVTARGPVLTPSQRGAAEVGRLLRMDPDGEERQKVYELLSVFLPVNRALREVCTDWQRLPDGSLNEHSDAAWDAEVRDRLEDVDTAIGRVIKRLTALRPELAHYRPDLTDALERFDAGEAGALTSPLSASYHNVWMWLHQELLLLLGVSRAEDEKLEAQLVDEQNG